MEPKKPPPASKPVAKQPPKKKKSIGKKVLAYRPTGGDMVSGWFFNRTYAAEHGIDYSGQSTGRKVGRFTANLGLFMLGIAASIAYHELAHLIMARALGVEFKWPATGFDGPLLPHWDLGEASQGRRVAIASVGFAAHIISTEVILLVPQIPKDNLFVLGFLLAGIVNNLLYPVSDAMSLAITGTGYGDIQVLRENGWRGPQAHIPLIAHSLFALARLIFLDDDFQKRFNPWRKQRASGADIVFRW